MSTTTHTSLLFCSITLLCSGCGLFAAPEADQEIDCLTSVLAGDGLDNDNDGIIDEGCACAFDGLSQGVCKEGVMSQDEAVCKEPSNYYAVEVYLCDGLDNNCDGLVDQGCRCEARGTNVGVCALGRVDESSGDCIDSPLLQNQESQCDGYDNDCDGTTDEDCQICPFQESNTGVCAFGVLSEQGICAPPRAYIKDEADQCQRDPLAGDGVDNDCDGQIDEGCACDFQGINLGVCSLGVKVTDTQCDAPMAYEPDEVTCDGFDNDCNGEVDEGCTVRVMPQTPTNTCGTIPEVCDEVDNNCDGIIDEGCATTPQCIPTSPMEVCDDQIDNNCDGQVDEDCDMGAVKSLFVSLYHTCAISQRDESVWCWGWNAMSDMSLQTLPELRAPRRVGTLTEVQTVATGGSHNCALTKENTVWCWGKNQHGQLGDGTQTNSDEPVQVQGITDVTRLALGPFHSCAIKSDETLWCWGWNADGQLGDGTKTNRSTPVQVQSWSDVFDVAMTEYRTCMLRNVDGGSVWCMGENDKGLLGDGSDSEDRTTPVQAVGLVGITDFILGPGFACALAADVGVWCWGSNSSGEVGDGTTTRRNAPAQVSGLVAPSALVSGQAYECLSSGDGPGAGWSCNGSTQTMCAQTSQGASCWGRNDQGQLGRGTQSMFEATPATVMTAVPLQNLSTDRNETCGISPQGDVWCWGLLPGQGPQPTPIQVQGLSNISTLGLGRSHACALDTSGGVWCWGSSAYGQLGHGTDMTSNTPIKIN